MQFYNDSLGVTPGLRTAGTADGKVRILAAGASEGPARSAAMEAPDNVDALPTDTT